MKPTAAWNASKDAASSACVAATSWQQALTVRSARSKGFLVGLVELPAMAESLLA